MIFDGKEIILKNGKAVTIKTPEVNDGTDMLRFISTACGETEFLLRNADEWAGVSTESEENWISSSRDDDRKLILACYVDGRIIGNCEICFLRGSKVSHRASIGIAILRDYWGLGIGSAMFEILLETARKHEGTEIVELEYVEGNVRGIALYKKFGFETVAERPMAIKLRDERIVSEFIMQKKL